MIRAGYIRKLASGTYTYLPLGWRSLLKIMNIVRDEMNSAGAQEILMPILQPMELWQRTGRNVVFEDIICHFTDHQGRENVLAPTAEEVVTTLVGAEVSSYRQLPMNLYQINTKIRDELRPRFGVLRSREFIMKDAYSFDATVEGLDESYRRMYDAYCHIFSRCGLECVIVEAESGGMGGSDTEEFMVLCSAGEDTVAHTEDYSYAANIEKAKVDPLPRAECAENVGDMEDVHTPNVGTIEAVCDFLHTKPEEMIKTLLYWDASESQVRQKMAQYSAAHRDGDADHSERASLDASGGYSIYVVIVRGDHEVNDAKLSSILGEEIGLIDPEDIESVTGAAVGFAGPVGLPEDEDVKLIIDHAVAAMPAGVTGANKTDYHTRNVVPGRDFPLAGDNVIVADIRNAVDGDTHDGKKLIFERGIEVGHVFKLGAKYSKQLGATFLDENGREQPCIMGCYGIGINRILASAIETGCDESGCVLPVNIAPFEAEVLQLNNNSEQVVAEATRIYKELLAAGIDVLLDDRDARPGVKFADADLIGIPLRVVVGDRGLKQGKVEIKRRTEKGPTLVTVADAAAQVRDILNAMKSG